jgi:methylmalonyl-CoA mutase cobalamin-binding subunit
VTLGLWRLHQVLRELSPAFQSEVERGDLGHRILLAPGPGEQHMFGLIMVADFFRRAGWNVWSGPVGTTAELAGMVRDEWFAVIGLSIGCGTRLDALSSCIRSVRRASRNQEIGVMVGGPMFIEHPELVALVGADATAIDGRQAVLQAQNLLDLLANRQ